MSLQVLVAALEKNIKNLVLDMEIKTDALIGNQCNTCKDEVLTIGNKNIYVFNRKYRGVGLNRNITLEHSTADIVTFADDDMKFKKGYEEIIIKAFDIVKDADIIIFNIETIGQNMGRKKFLKIKRLHFYNILNYGIARVSAKRKSLIRDNIKFHTCFGGGAIYSAGEDTLFLVEALKKKLKIYSYPITIASVDQTSSTWFKGYNKKYLFDKGALFSAILPKVFILLCIQDLIRHPELYKTQNISIFKALKIMMKGGRAFKVLKKYEDLKEYLND